MNKEVIILKDVCKSYPFFKMFNKERFYAISNISLSITEGESVAFLGKNGAGKTILLKIISGIVYPTSGEIIVSRPVSPIFGFGAGFHPELTGVENIFLYGSLLGIERKEIQTRLNEVIELSELENFLTFKLKHYSTGMGIRLAFSVASLLKPEILILDEALSVGDQGFIQKAHNKIRELQNRNLTMLVTSHSHELLKRFCKRGVVLDQGKILYEGEINQAVDFYRKEVLLVSDNQNIMSKASKTVRLALSS